MEKLPKQEFDKYNAHYDSQIEESLAFSGQEHDFYLKLKADHLLNLIQTKFEKKSEIDVLDIGCGHGLMHKFLISPEINLSASDPASSVIKEAIRLNPDVDYQANDGHTLNYADNSFDVAFTVCVMHHVVPEQWHDFLKEMKRVIKPSGLLVVYEHNPYNPMTLYIVKTCPIDANAVLLKSTKLRALMKSVGLIKTSNEYIIFFPAQNENFRKIEKMLTWLPLGAQYCVYAEV